MTGIGLMVTCWLALIGFFLTFQLEHLYRGIFEFVGVLVVSTLIIPLLLGRWAGARASRWSILKPFAPMPQRRVIYYTGVGSTLLCLVASLGFSYHYWGYVFMRPPILVAPAEIGKITSLAQVETPYEEGATLKANGNTLPDLLSLHKKYNYSFPWGRVPGALFQGGHLHSSIPQTSQAILAKLQSHLKASKDELIDQGEGSYRESAGKFRGTVIEFEDQSGQSMLLASLTSGQVSNDHFAYYELLFPMKGAQLGELGRWNKFYYDVAGIEGLEWWILTPFLSLLGFILVLPVTTLVSSLHQQRLYLQQSV
jgi:hypothetical protein